MRSSLPALVSYLEAEDESGAGLDVATPTAADTVKLLTVHRAKGLEWDAVFLVGVAKDKFPTKQGRTKWTAGPGVLPYPLRGDAVDLPGAPGCDAGGAEAVRGGVHAPTSSRRSSGWATSRSPGPGTSSRCRPTSGTASRKTPCGPSPYQETARTFLDEPGPRRRGGRHAGATGHRRRTRRRREPAARLARARPVAGQPRTALRCGGAPRRRCRCRRSARLLTGGPDPAPGPDEELDQASRARRRRLGRRARPAPGGGAAPARRRGGGPAAVQRCRPPRWPASARTRWRSPSSWPGRCRDRRRPPRGSAPGSTPGWRATSSRSRQDLLVDPDELSGRADLGVDDDADLRQLIDRFRGGAVRRPAPTWRSSRRSRWCSAARWSAGGSTRCSPSPTAATSWSTGRRTGRTPPTRCSWRSTGWPGPSCGGCRWTGSGRAFYYVRDAEVVVVEDLPGRAGARGACVS